MRSFEKRFFQTILATLVVSSCACKPAAAASSDEKLFQTLTDFGYSIYLFESGFFKQANAKTTALLAKLDKEPVQKSQMLIPLLRSDTSCGDTHRQLYAEVLEIRALSRFQLKQNAPAIADLKRAIELCPEHAYLHSSLGSLYLRSKRPKNALPEIDSALKLNPNLSEAYLSKAAYYQAVGKRREAQQNLAKAKSLISSRQRLLGSLTDKIDKLCADRKTDELLPADIEFLSEFPRDVYAVKGYADHLADSGKNQDALKYANLAVLLDPTYVGGYRVRSKVYGLLNKPELALADATRAFIMEPRSAEALNARALANLDIDRPFEAIRDFDLLLQLKPDYVDAYINRSAALSRVGRFEDSIKDARKAYALAPSSPYGYQALGAALRRARQFPEAKRALEESLKYKSSATQDSLAMAEFNLGATLKELNETAANEHLDEALKLAPNLPTVLLVRGTYDARQSAPDRGISVLTKPPKRRTSHAEPAQPRRRNAAGKPGSDNGIQLTRLSSGALSTPLLKNSRATSNMVSKTVATTDDKFQHVSVPDLLDCVLAASRQIENDAAKPTPYYIRGIANFCLGKFEDASKDLTRYDQLVPDNKRTGSVLAQLARFRAENSSHPGLPTLTPAMMRGLIGQAKTQSVSP